MLFYPTPSKSPSFSQLTLTKNIKNGMRNFILDGFVIVNVLLSDN